MNHPDWPAFLAAIVADPDDNTPRLVAADFLEEHGEHDRADFIRVQIALAGGFVARDPAELAHRERMFLHLLSTYAPLWAARECPELVRVLTPAPGTSAEARVEGADRLVWRRGFIERVYCTAPEWLRHGVSIRSRNPVRQVALDLNYEPSCQDWLAGLPALEGLLSVDLYRFPGPPEDGFFAWLGGLLPGTQVSRVS
jgi:uncharacterized protein (TIGR02996 family)